MARYDSYGSYDNDEDKSVVSESDAKLQRSRILSEKDPKAKYAELRKLMGSKTRVKYAALDTKFLKDLDEEYPDKNYSQMIKDTADAIVASDPDSEKELQMRVAKKLANIQRLSDYGDAISGSLESPGKELFEGLVKALKNSAKLNAELMKQSELYKLDENNDPNINKFLQNELPDGNLKDKVTDGDKETKGESDKSVNKPDNAKRLNLPKSKLSDKERENLKNKIVDEKYYLRDDEGVIKAGPFNFKDDAVKNKADGLHPLKGKTYKDNYLFSSYANKKVVVVFTMVKKNNLFAKLSEFVKERFPNEFSNSSSERINLKDGRFMKVKFNENSTNFTMSIYKNNILQNSIELPLKVHKYFWQNEINNKLIKKD